MENNVSELIQALRTKMSTTELENFLVFEVADKNDIRLPKDGNLEDMIEAMDEMIEMEMIEGEQLEQLIIGLENKLAQFNAQEESQENNETEQYEKEEREKYEQVVQKAREEMVQEQDELEPWEESSNEQKVKEQKEQKREDYRKAEEVLSKIYEPVESYKKAIEILASRNTGITFSNHKNSIGTPFLESMINSGSQYLEVINYAIDKNLLTSIDVEMMTNRLDKLIDANGGPQNQRARVTIKENILKKTQNIHEKTMLSSLSSIENVLAAINAIILRDGKINFSEYKNSIGTPFLESVVNRGSKNEIIVKELLKRKLLNESDLKTITDRLTVLIEVNNDVQTDRTRQREEYVEMFNNGGQEIEKEAAKKSTKAKFNGFEI